MRNTKIQDSCTTILVGKKPVMMVQPWLLVQKTHKMVTSHLKKW